MKHRCTRTHGALEAVAPPRIHSTLFAIFSLLVPFTLVGVSSNARAGGASRSAPSGVRRLTVPSDPRIQSQTDTLFVQGEVKAGFLAGQTMAFGAPTGTFMTEPSFNRNGGVKCNANAPGQGFYVEIGNPEGTHLQVGSYPEANTYYTPNGAFIVAYQTDPIFAGCNVQEGRFDVKQIEYTPDSSAVTAIWVTFEERCLDLQTWVVGEYRLNVTPTIEFEGPRIVTATTGKTMQFDLHAYDAQAAPVALAAYNLPPSSSFSDLGGGYARFAWKPLDGEGGWDRVVTVVGDNGAGVVDSIRVRIQVFEQPHILSFTPESGTVGRTVYIYCDHLESGVTDVLFNGVSTFSSIFVDQNMIGALVPPGATTGPISVVTNAGTAVSRTPFTVQLPPPQIFDFRPRQAPLGTEIRIVGRYFGAGVNQVTFGGVPATFRVESDSVVFANASASGQVGLDTPSGSTQSYYFTEGPLIEPIVLAGFDPPSGPEETLVRLHGRFPPGTFDNPIEVFFGTIRIDGFGNSFMRAVGDTLLVFSVPRSAQDAPIRIANATNVVVSDTFRVTTRVLGEATLDSGAGSGHAIITQRYRFPFGGSPIELHYEYSASGLAPSTSYLASLRRGTCDSTGDLVLFYGGMFTGPDGSGSGQADFSAVEFEMLPLAEPAVFCISTDYGAPCVLCGSFEGAAPPTFDPQTPFVPYQAPPGAQVAIHGTHLGRTTGVTLMGRPVEFQVVDDSRLTVRIPEGAESGPFTVTSSWGVVRSLSDFFVGPPPPPTYYTLTVDVVGQGTVARNPDKPAYEAGEIVELTALPAAGWTFVGWSLDSVPSGNPVRTVVMNDNTYVVATFDSLPPTFYTLAVTVVGQGTVTRNPDKPQYQAGEIVELTAIPAPGWTFVGWSLDTVPSGNPVRTVVMNSNQTVTATFAAVPIDSAVAMGFELHPRNLNLDSNGRWVSGVLTPPAPYDATDIDVSSIRLGGSVAVSNEHAVKAQKKDRSLAVKFSRADVERVLASGERVPVVVTGIIGGRPFRGVDYVRTRGGSRTEFPAAGIGEGKAVFALQPSNPIRGALAIRFSLASEAPARLSVFDVTGRRVADRDVGGSDPGWRIVQLGDVPDGIYLVRLSQGGRRLTARVAVIQ